MLLEVPIIREFQIIRPKALGAILDKSQYKTNYISSTPTIDFKGKSPAESELRITPSML